MDNIDNGIDEILEELNNEISDNEVVEHNFEIVGDNSTTEEKQIENANETVPDCESWALVCYTEKTTFQKIIYSIKKLLILTKKRLFNEN